MYYVYVLQSEKDSLLYIGFTEHLESRILRHQNGESASTKFRRPLKLIFYEAYFEKEDALRREKYFKTTKGKAALKVMLKGYFSRVVSNRFISSKSP